MIGHNAGGQAARQLAESCFDLRRQLYGIRAGLLLHRDDNGGRAIDTGIAAFDARGKVNSCHLAQEDRLAIARDNHDVAQIIELGGAADISDQILAVILVDKATPGIAAERPDCLFDLLDGDVEARERRDVRRHTVLAHRAADRDDLTDASDGQQARPDHEIRDLAHGHRVGLIAACHGDQHDLTHDR